MWNRLGFKDRLLLVGFSLLVLVLVALGGGASALVDRHLRGELQARSQQLIPLLNAALAAPMAQRDYASVAAIVDELKDTRDLVYLEVLDAAGRSVTGPRTVQPPLLTRENQGDTLPFSAPIALAGQPLGRVDFSLSRRAIEETRHSILVGIGLLSAGALALFSLALAVFSVAVTRPLKSLITAARDIQAGNYDVELSSHRQDEFGMLMKAFGKMTQEVRRKVSELVQSENLQRRYLQESVRRQQETTVALQQAQAANRTKSDFIANMSHEIRTPMNSVIGYAELLRRTPLGAQQEAYLGRLQESSTALLGLINDILDFSKIEAGHLESQTEDFDLRSMIDTVCGLFTPALRDKGLVLDKSLGSNVPTRLVGDRLRVQQVLTNLLSNAVKFTSQGQIEVRITSVPDDTTARQEDERNVRLRFAVRDTGIGISQDQLAQVFQPFSQADSSITRRFGGTGLGLSISRSLAELMGGTLEVHSELGLGSEFALTLPFAQVTGTNRQASLEAPAEAAEPAPALAEPSHREAASQPASNSASPEPDLLALALPLRDLDRALEGKMMKARPLAEQLALALEGGRWASPFAPVLADTRRLRFLQARESLSFFLTRLPPQEGESAG